VDITRIRENPDRSRRFPISDVASNPARNAFGAGSPFEQPVGRAEQAPELVAICEAGDEDVEIIDEDVGQDALEARAIVHVLSDTR
jgi:hypothetical protein